MLKLLMTVCAIISTAHSQEQKETAPKPMKCDEAFWKQTIFPNIKKVKKKVVRLTSKIYDEKVVSNTTGEFISDRPWFVMVITDPMDGCDQYKYMMQGSANAYDGKIQFAYTYAGEDSGMDAAFREPGNPALYYLSKDNYTYGMGTYQQISQKIIKEFIDEGHKDVMRFKTPQRVRGGSVFGGQGLYQNYKKFYEKYMQRMFEGYFRDQKMAYYTDVGGRKNKRESQDVYTDRQLTFFTIVLAISSVCASGVIWLAIKLNTTDPNAPKAPRRKQQVDSCCGPKNPFKDQEPVDDHPGTKMD